MDDFVRRKLAEWGLSVWIGRFEDEGIDKESLYCLCDQEIDNLIPKLGPRAKFKKRLKSLKKEQNTANQATVDSSAQCNQAEEEAADSAQVRPSTSDTSNTGKRKLDPQGESSKGQSTPSKRRSVTKHGSDSEKVILSDVKKIMSLVAKKIPNDGNTRLNNFLKDKISDLETDKREVVGVFGKSGAGKSTLINAIIGEENLLPSGNVRACTAVIIKVDANMLSSKYDAEIEFISQEEWKDELWSLYNFLGENSDHKKSDDDYLDLVEKLSSVYGEEWKDKSPEKLMDHKYFREIPEFLFSGRKVLTCVSAKELSAKCVKYTRSDFEDGEGNEVKRGYWPLVKCVTIRVPGNDFLQHVTLVDLPGNGDRNKSRNKMWKEVVGSCSTVWIVTEINRAASEEEAWEILENASGQMGNGGQCQQIHFICTKSDCIGRLGDPSADGVRAFIFKRNKRAKEEVSKEFSKLSKVKKHFSDDCFKVFTVSPAEFLKKDCLEPDETEIPKLQEFLQNLNDCHSETLNYVTGAYGILSLMQGTKSREVADKKIKVCKELEERMRPELNKVIEPMDAVYKAFEKCLNEGVETSKTSCERVLKSSLTPKGIKGGAFHKILKCVVENGGTYKPKGKKLININAALASCLTDSIDEEFQKTFPNERKCRPFNGVINKFSLDTKTLIQKHKDVELQLIFLKTEEEKIKTKLNNIIRERKKTVYSSLTTTIEMAMEKCYTKAAEFRGQDSLKNMRETIEKHVYGSKNNMFEQAKDVMLNQLRDLKEDIVNILEETMQTSIDLSLKTDGDSIPDVTSELERVKKYNHELRGSPNGQTPMFAQWRETAEVWLSTEALCGHTET